MVVLGLAAGGCGRIRFDAIADTGPGVPADAALGAIAQNAYIKDSNTGGGDGFGERMALSADGSTWSQQGYVKASNAKANMGFGGRGIGVSGDGSTLVVG